MIVVDIYENGKYPKVEMSACPIEKRKNFDSGIFKAKYLNKNAN